MITCRECELDQNPTDYPQFPVTRTCQGLCPVCSDCWRQRLGLEDHRCPCGCGGTADAAEVSFLRAWLRDNDAFDSVIGTSGGAPNPSDAGKSDEEAMEGTVTVANLNRDIVFTLDLAAMGNSVETLRKAVSAKSQIPVAKLRVMMGTVELDPSDQKRGLSSYGLRDGAHLHCIRVLHNAQSNMQNLVFKVQWGVPRGNATGDFLDAMCFVRLASGQYKHANYKHNCAFQGENVSEAVFHCGDAKFSDGRSLHIIRINLAHMPDEVDALFFTLSAWEAANITAYIRPNISLYDESNSEVELSSYDIGTMRPTPSVVMCRMRRLGGKWTVEAADIDVPNGRADARGVQAIQAMLSRF